MGDGLSLGFGRRVVDFFLLLRKMGEARMYDGKSGPCPGCGVNVVTSGGGILGDVWFSPGVIASDYLWEAVDDLVSVLGPWLGEWDGRLLVLLVLK